MAVTQPIFSIPKERFQGALTDLLGRPAEEVCVTFPPDEVVDAGRARRFFWREEGVEPSGERVRLLFQARIYDDTVWAVGVGAEDYFFVIRNDDRDEPHLVVIPKRSGRDAPQDVNWIVEVDGELENHGVGP